MTTLTGKAGFATPTAENSLSRKRIAGVELFATLALALSLIVAATAVSFGVARAQSIVRIRTGVTACSFHSAAPACAPRLRTTLQP